MRVAQLADLSRIDVDVNDFRVRREFVDLAGGLAAGDHVDQQGRKDAAGGERPGHAPGSADREIEAGRAGGGPVWSGREYLVGEEGPELFVPRTSGTIVPNGGTPSPLQGFAGLGQNVTYIENVNLRNERNIDRWVQKNQRAQHVMSGRGS